MNRRSFLATSTLLSTTLLTHAEDKVAPAKPAAGKVVKTEEEWKKQLTEIQFKVTRKQATEPPFKNEYHDNHEKGTYQCVCCEQPLYSSEAKFESGTGWPSFFQPIAPDKIGTTEDKKLFSVRTEVHCSRCEAHLGHVFNDAPSTPTGMRYCMNSASMKFIPAKAK
jgi:peptide-methionine (R)-S-oxide reductase